MPSDALFMGVCGFFRGDYLECELCLQGGRLAPPVHKYVHLSHIFLKYNGFNSLIVAIIVFQATI